MVWSLIVSVFLIGVSLSMDAFAVSICDGMIYRGISNKKRMLIPTTFGVFQAVMPIIGFYVGLVCLDLIDSFDHWIAFGLLVIIGGKMIVDGILDLLSKDENAVEEKKFSYVELLVQGVATSIDALAVGFSLNAMLDGFSSVQLWAWICVIIIGITTFAISTAGVFFGTKVGALFKKKASIATIIGGVVLLLIGVKIVVGAYYSLPF